jgi:hypothetical protein
MPQYLDKLPIALPDSHQKRALEDVARRAMREGYDSVKAELNDIIYRLYGLAEEEIAIVEERG